VLFGIFVAVGRDRELNGSVTVGAGFVEIPGAGFEIHAVVGGEVEGGVRSDMGGGGEFGVEDLQVGERFGRVRWVHVHGVIGGVDVEEGEVGAVGEVVNDGVEKPVVDFGGVDIGRGAVTLDQSGCGGFGGDDEGCAGV